MKKIQFDNSHIAQDILQKRKEFESKPPTLDEIAETTAAAYQAKQKLKQKPLPLSQEQWDEKLKTIITNTGISYPEKSEAFLDYIPDMHRCWAALEAIGKCETLAKVYASVMTKIYDESFPFEIEKKILALDEEELIWQLAKREYRWSHRAQRIMLCLHPKAYEKVFAETHQTMAIIAL